MEINTSSILESQVVGATIAIKDSGAASYSLHEKVTTFDSDVILEDIGCH